MENILSYLSILQGLFLLSTPYFDNKNKQCRQSNNHKVVQYIHEAVGTVSVLFGVLLLVNDKNIISPLIHFAVMAFLFLTAFIATLTTDKDCRIEWLIYEELAVALIFIVAFMSKFKNGRTNL